MKNIYVLLGLGLASMLVGCSSTPVVLAPVGPDPVGSESPAPEGELQVFSRMVGHSEGNNPTWHQHSEYYIYDLQGKLLERVHDTTGHYAKAPCLVALPIGSYLVKAQASDYFWVEVPVIIERGRTTKVHLDDHWAFPGDTSSNGLVSLPNGHPVGWRAASAKENGGN